MNREEFIKTCVQSCYASKHAAEHYADESGKSEFTDSDIVELYHMSMHWEGCASDKGLRSVFGMHGKTTAMSNGIAGNSSSHTDWK